MTLARTLALMFVLRYCAGCTHACETRSLTELEAAQRAETERACHEYRGCPGGGCLARCPEWPEIRDRYRALRVRRCQ